MYTTNTSTGHGDHEGQHRNLPGEMTRAIVKLVHRTLKDKEYRPEGMVPGWTINDIPSVYKKSRGILTFEDAPTITFHYNANLPLLPHNGSSNNIHPNRINPLTQHFRNLGKPQKCLCSQLHFYLDDTPTLIGTTFTTKMKDNFPVLVGVQSDLDRTGSEIEVWI